MVDTDTIPPAQIAFDVVNAPLRQPLAIDAFVLCPVDDVAGILKWLKRAEGDTRCQT